MSAESISPQNGQRRSGAVKRIMQELRELQENQSSDFQACPLEDNLFEWHFTIRGPAETEFQGGVYHGRLMLPSGYPFHPPDLMLLTPSGRFEVGKKICLSISGYHPEYWQPSWSIRTVLVALIAFMPTDPQGAIGSLNYSPEERRALARESVSWTCQGCGSSNAECFGSSELTPQITTDTNDVPVSNPPENIHPDQNVEEILSTEIVDIKRDASSGDVIWTSVIVALVAAIFAILIKKAIST